MALHFLQGLLIYLWFSLPTGVAAVSCHAHPKHSETQFFVCSTPSNWTMAELTCTTVFKGHLASILNETKNTVLTRILQNANCSSNKSTHWWIGLKRSPGSSFTWSDNSSSEYRKFVPVPANHAKDCVYLQAGTKTRSAKWKTANCNKARRCFVCESKLPSISSSPMSLIPTSPMERSVECRQSHGNSEQTACPEEHSNGTTLTAPEKFQDNNKNEDSSAAAVASGVVGAFIGLALVVVVTAIYVYRRRGKYVVAEETQESHCGNQFSANHVSNSCNNGQTLRSHPVRYSATVDTTNERHYHELFFDEVRDDSQERGEEGDVNRHPYAYAYVAQSAKGGSMEQSIYSSPELTVNSCSTHTVPSYKEEPYATPGQVFSADGRTDDVYWEPATSVQKLYHQFEGKKFRRIAPSELLIREPLGSGEFGTVAKGTWQGSGSGTAVAVKMLNSSSEGDRVRFLQEGAIMGQFRHDNVVALRGLVLEGEPLMMALEFMENGDLKQHLESLSQGETPGLASRLLRMARDVAAGMQYLAQKAFVHRDLAIRNVMLDGEFTCKIGDFGLARDLKDNDYYVTNGGKIPIRWTAPEAIMYRKYSAFSDVWSYGVALYEMWTVGQRPYHFSWSNKFVIEKLETGYRLPPPSGCSHGIYKLMIRCWHPDRHQRPSFDQIVIELNVADDELLANAQDVEPIHGRLGEEADITNTSYEDLQNAYIAMEIVE